MTEIRKRLDELRQRLDATTWHAASARVAARRRKHLSLLRDECDALRRILDEIGMSAAGGQEWASTRNEFDQAVDRLERSFAKARSREAARRRRRRRQTSRDLGLESKSRRQDVRYASRERA